MNPPAQPKGIVAFVLEGYKRRTVGLVGLLLLSGMLEGLGIAAVLPLLETLMSGEGAADSGLSVAVGRALGWFGIQPSIEILLAVLVIAFALKGLVMYVAFLQVGVLIAKLTMELRVRLLRAVAHAEWRHVLDYPAGFIANAVSAETHRSASAYQGLATVIAWGAQVLAYVVVAFLVSWQAALASVVAGLAIIFFMSKQVDVSRTAGGDQVRVLRDILARLTDALPSLKPLKAMGRVSYLLPHLEEATEEYFRAQKREIASTELIRRFREPALMAVLATGFWVIVTYTTMDSTSLLVMAFLFYRAAAGLTNMQQYWVTVRVGEKSFLSLMDHIHAAEGAREWWPQRGGREAPAFQDRITLEGVTFSYGDHEVLHDVDAELQAGSFVAVVGPSGSGKTTLTDLVTGLLRPTRGTIRIDGVDLMEIDLLSWRAHIGYVPQEPMLFSDSVRNNLTLRIAGVTDDRLEDALRSASAWDFVRRLDGGLDHHIGESGRALSGGQKQRLAIARALVRRPSLLILDEPTTALDAVSEAEVCEAISGLRGGLTVLAISHQPAIRSLASEIWKIDSGRLTCVPGVASEVRAS